MTAKLSTRLGHAIETIGYTGARRVCEALGIGRGPDVMAALARGIGPLSPLKRRAERNLYLAMPELDSAARSAILQGMFDHFTRVAVEYLYLPELIADPAQGAFARTRSHHGQSEQVVDPSG